MWKKCYKMEIGDFLEEYSEKLIRVPGGWIHIFANYCNGVSSVFVPFANDIDVTTKTESAANQPFCGCEKK